MKRIMCATLAVAMFSNVALADCKWADGIKKTEGGYLYTPECHAKVGVTLRDNDDLKIEVKELRKTIELKDLAIKTADQRTQEWMDTSFKLEKRIDNIESAANKNKWVYYGLGVLTVFAAGYAAKQVYGGR